MSHVVHFQENCKVCNLSCVMSGMSLNVAHGKRVSDLPRRASKPRIVSGNDPLGTLESSLRSLLSISPRISPALPQSTQESPVRVEVVNPSRHDRRARSGPIGRARDCRPTKSLEHSSRRQVRQVSLGSNESPQRNPRQENVCGVRRVGDRVPQDPATQAISRQIGNSQTLERGSHASANLTTDGMRPRTNQSSSQR